MKTSDELNTLKEQVESLSKKLAELSEDELREVTGGFNPDIEHLIIGAPKLYADSYVPEPNRGLDFPASM